MIQHSDFHMRTKVKKIGIHLLKVGVSVVAIWWVMSKISFKEVMDVFSASNIYYLFCASFFIILALVFSAFRQNLSFRNTGADISQLLNIKLLWLGLFYNLFLPGGIGGDGIKVYLVNKYRKNGIKKNIEIMLVNRFSGLVVIGFIAVLLYYLSGLQINYGKAAWVGIPLVYALYYFILKFFFKRSLKIHARLLLWSLALQMMEFFSALFILLAFQQTSGMFDYLFLFFVSAIATAIPITIGGIGAREIVIMVSATTLGLDNKMCISLSFMFFLVTSIISFGGFYWVLFSPFRHEMVTVQTSN